MKTVKIIHHVETDTFLASRSRRDKSRPPTLPFRLTYFLRIFNSFSVHDGQSSSVAKAKLFGFENKLDERNIVVKRPCFTPLNLTDFLLSINLFFYLDVVLIISRRKTNLLSFVFYFLTFLEF